jgi:FG-GAP-like repeat
VDSAEWSATQPCPGEGPGETRPRDRQGWVSTQSLIRDEITLPKLTGSLGFGGSLSCHLLPNSILGDFNNSGHLGLVATDVDTENVGVLLGNGDGTFTHSSAFVLTGPDPNSLAVGDWNGDGNLDMAIAPSFGGADTVIELGYSDGAFNLPTAQTITPVIDEVQTAIAAGDFNGDGKLDLAVTSEANTVTILLGNGDGTFSQAHGSPISVGNFPAAIAVCDFNGDGKLDLAVANLQDDTVTILLGKGDGTFTPSSGSPISVGSEPGAIAIGDFTGNGKPGLAVANSGSNNVTILSGNGDGTFTPAPGSPVSTGAAPSLLAAGDFNGSGRLGLAVGNTGDHTISILVQH